MSRGIMYRHYYLVVYENKGIRTPHAKATRIIYTSVVFANTIKGITARGNECGPGLHNGSISEHVKKIDMNGVVNINGIERKIYSVAAAAQFPHHAFINGSYSLKTFQISRCKTARQHHSVSCDNHVCSCHWQ